MIRTVLSVAAVLLGLLLVAAARRPDRYRVERRTSIAAPAESIFPLIADLRRWVEWSPYEGRDPDLRRVYGGPDSAPGAFYEWEGNRQVGRGRMDVADASAPDRVTIHLRFLAPFEGRGTAEFSLSPRGDSTEVTWAMHGPNTYFGRLMSLFFSMDRMLGGDFEQGLANLKSVVERERSTTGWGGR